MWSHYVCYLALLTHCFSCVMTLTKGTGSYFPCPVCLVPDDKLAIHDTTYPLRTQATMKKIYNDAMAMKTVDESNNLLKKYGLCGIDVSDLYHPKYCY